MTILRHYGHRVGHRGTPTPGDSGSNAGITDIVGAMVTLLKPGAIIFASNDMTNGLVRTVGTHDFNSNGLGFPPWFDGSTPGILDGAIARYVYSIGAIGGGVSDSTRTFSYLLSDDGIEGHAPHRHEIIVVVVFRLIPSIGYTPDVSVAGALFEWPPSNNHKITAIVETDGGAATEFHWLYIGKNETNGNTFNMFVNPEVDNSIGATFFNQNPGDVAGEVRSVINIGQWCCAGLRIKQSSDLSILSSDGEYEMYVSTNNGTGWTTPVRNLNRTNINTRGVARGCYFSDVNTIMMSGGGGVQTATQTERQVDHVAIAA